MVGGPVVITSVVVGVAGEVAVLVDVTTEVGETPLDFEVAVGLYVSIEAVVVCNVIIFSVLFDVTSLVVGEAVLVLEFAVG